MTAYTFDQLITFTRTSAATYVGSNGLVAVTPASRNLLQYTQDFDNAVWSKTNAQVVPNVDPATATFGVELVTNGDFSAGATGWIVAPGGTGSVTGGQAVITDSGAASNVLLRQVVATVAGRLYRITYNVVSTNQNTAAYLGSVLGASIAGTGTRTFYLVAAANNANLEIVCATVNGIVTIDNVSVREIVGGLITAPDGTPTADTLIATAGTGAIPRVADISTTTINAAAYTASIYVRAGTYTFFQIYINNQGAEWANFTLTGAGAASANGSCTATITALSGGWYRCTMSYTAGGTDRRPFFMLAASGTATRAQTWNPTGTESILIWGAQLEAASSASTYTRNNGGVYPPRFDYDPVTRAPRGLLIEEQRTNLLLRSEEFDNAAWVKTAVTATANATTSPDGTADADSIIETTANSTHDVNQSATLSAVAYTYSAFVKANGRSWVRLFAFQSGPGSTSVWFNVSTGVVGTVGAGASNATITNFGNGWYRCAFTFTAVAASASLYVQLATADNGASGYTGDGTSGIYLWGAQLEAGAFATSYIPTVASQVTRTADLAAITAPMFAPWYRQSEGTLVVQAVTSKPTSVAATGLAVDVSDGGINNRHYIGVVSASAEARTVVGGVNQALITQAYTANAIEKYGYAVKENDFAFYRNGSQAGLDTTGSMPTVNRMFIGNAAGSAAFWNGHIQSIDYYPTRLTNAQIQALTA